MIWIIPYSELFPFLRALLSIQHICYYLPKPKPYYCSVSLYVVYIFMIHWSLFQLIQRDYTTSLLNITIQLFILPANIASLISTNTKVSFISLFISKARLCLSCKVPLVTPAVQSYVFFIFFLSVYRILHVFCYSLTLHFRNKITQR